MGQTRLSMPNFGKGDPSLPGWDGGGLSPVVEVVVVVVVVSFKEVVDGEEEDVEGGEEDEGEGEDNDDDEDGDDEKSRVTRKGLETFRASRPNSQCVAIGGPFVNIVVAVEHLAAAREANERELAFAANVWMKLWREAAKEGSGGRG